jgi:hypothetical protein
MKPLEIHSQGMSIATEDQSMGRIDAQFLKPKSGRDPMSNVPLVNQFLDLNRGILRSMDIKASLAVNRSRVEILMESGTMIGSIPLLSPISGKPEIGLSIRPRFGWSGIGPMMHSMGWKIVPRLLKLPLPPQSDKQIPGWVLASAVLLRLQALIESLTRRFEMEESDLQTPRGTINWQRYIRNNMTRGRLIDLPCAYPTIRDDRTLKAAIHFSLLHQINDLESQRSQAAVVLPLLELAYHLLRKVHDVHPLSPPPGLLESWRHGIMRNNAFALGIEAIEWTVNETGLAGLSQSSGIPWIMSMSEFFEAWIETLAGAIARKTGGFVRSGRRRQTVVPLEWHPPYAGTQKSLIPDIVIERENEVVIIDAKYKDHWEEFNLRGWYGVLEATTENHRADLLQVLAYASLYDAKKVTSWLVYPCSTDAWNEACKRNQTHYRASVPCGDKSINLILSAVPMESTADVVAEEMIKTLNYVQN